MDKGIDELTTDKLKNRQMNGHIFLTLYWNLHVKLNNVDKRTFKMNISILTILPGGEPKCQTDSYSTLLSLSRSFEEEKL